MKTSMYCKRIKNIRINVEFDEGKSGIDFNVSRDELLNRNVAIDSIHTLGTLLSSLIAEPIKKYIDKNPIETQLIKDWRSNRIYMNFYATDIKYKDDGKCIVKFNEKKTHKPLLYTYNTYDELMIDIDYIRSQTK